MTSEKTYTTFHDSGGLAAVAAALRAQQAAATEAAPSKAPQAVKKRKDEALVKEKKKRRLKEEEEEAPVAPAEKKASKKPSKKEKKKAKQVTPSESEEESESSEEEESGEDSEVAEEVVGGKDDEGEVGAVRTAVGVRNAARAAGGKPEDADLRPAHAASVAAGAEEAFFDTCGEVGSRAVAILNTLLARSRELMGEKEAADAGKTLALAAQVRVSGGAQGVADLAKEYAGLPLWSAIQRHSAGVAAKVNRAVRTAHGDSAAAGEKEEGAPEEKQRERTFRDFYMGAFTEAFAGELDTMRTGGEGREGLSVGLLMDSIQAGVDVFTPLEKELVCEGLSARSRS